MQISLRVVLAGGGEGAEPSLGLPTPAPTPGGWLQGDAASSRGRSSPKRARRSPGARFRFYTRPVSVLAVQSRCGALAATRQFIPKLETGGERRGGVAGKSQGDCRALWNVAGPNVRRREGPAARAPRPLRGRTHLPGKPIAVPAPQLYPRLRHARAFRDRLGQLPPVTKGPALPREGEAHPQGHPARRRRHGQIWNSEPRAPDPALLSLFFSGETCFQCLTLTQISHLSRNWKGFPGSTEAPSIF